MSAASLFPVFVLSLIIAALGTPVARRIAWSLGLVDEPAGHKKHAEPIALLGGLALYGAVIAGLVAFSHRRELIELGGILAGATWISLWGLWDDRSGLRPSFKLLAQIAAAALLAASGVAVQLALPGPLNFALTVFWIVGITNAFNLLDNMDGLAGGLAAIASAFFLLLAVLNGQILVGALAAAVLGSCLGFLLHNFNPARIFMGDSGSLFLGFVLAAVGIKLRFPEARELVTWMVPVLILALPILDTTLVVVSRLKRGLNPLTNPGRDHLSHRLRLAGMSTREAVLTLYIGGFATGLVGALVSVSPPLVAYGAAVIVALVGLAVISRLEGSVSPDG